MEELTSCSNCFNVRHSHGVSSLLLFFRFCRTMFFKWCFLWPCTKTDPDSDSLCSRCSIMTYSELPLMLPRTRWRCWMRECSNDGSERVVLKEFGDEEQGKNFRMPPRPFSNCAQWRRSLCTRKTSLCERLYPWRCERQELCISWVVVVSVTSVPVSLECISLEWKSSYTFCEGMVYHNHTWPDFWSMHHCPQTQHPATTGMHGWDPFSHPAPIWPQILQQQQTFQCWQLSQNFFFRMLRTNWPMRLKSGC